MQMSNEWGKSQFFHSIDFTLIFLLFFPIGYPKLKYKEKRKKNTEPKLPYIVKQKSHKH